ncbi:MAG: ABC transporter permease [Pseudomonadota bacterium]
MAVTDSAPRGSVNDGGFALAARLALRELRGGIKGFYIFLACIAIGVATIAGVGSLSSAMVEGLAKEGRSVLGGDLALRVIHREAAPEEYAIFDQWGAVSTIATTRAMARASAENQTLVEVKAVDDLYPLAGELTLDRGARLQNGLGGDGDVRGAVVEEAMMVRLGLELGDRFDLGNLAFEIRDVVVTEPDRLSGGPDFGPRVFLTLDDLRATGLIQPGSLVRWTYRIAMPAGMTDAGVTAAREAAIEEFGADGWSVRSRLNAAPGLSSSIDRFAQFLTLVGLTALIVGGVGVANAVRSYLETKRSVIATLKAVGASGGFVFTVYLVQIMAIAVIGIAIGLAIGALVPIIAGALLANILPVSAAGGLYPGALLLAVAYGLLTALAFALWPLGRARDVPVSALFRDRVSNTRQRPRDVYIVAVVVVMAALIGLAVGLSDSKLIAVIYVGGSVVTFLLLRLVALGIMALAARVPPVRNVALRLAIRNIHRPDALTTSVVLSLGLGLTLFVALAQIDGNLSRQLTSSLPDRAPSFFFVDIQKAERERFRDLMAEIAPGGEVETVPMLRGRITALKGIAAEDFDAPPEAAWVLRGDRGITHSATMPKEGEIVEGEWWPADYDGPPLVSFVDEEARELGLEVGDMLAVNILGRTIEARIANLRTVNWTTMGINFLMVFTPNTFEGAPYSVLATLTYDGGVDSTRDSLILRDVTQAFPTVTSVRVKDALDTVNGILGQLGTAIRAASGITLVASILVLAGALAAGHRLRIYDSVVMKTLGATRGRLVTAYAAEYVILGLATALFGVAAGTLAAWAVVSLVMQFEFTMLASVAFIGAAIALVLTVTLGMGGTWQVLSRKPARVLRAL